MCADIILACKIIRWIKRIFERAEFAPRWPRFGAAVRAGGEGDGALQQGMHRAGACMMHCSGAALVRCIGLGFGQLQFVTIDLGIQGTIGAWCGQTYMQHGNAP